MEDGAHAKGIWWHSRVGTQKNIPPREHGGTDHWKNVTPLLLWVSWEMQKLEEV